MVTFLSDKKSPEMILTSQVAATTPSIPVSENGSNCLSSLQGRWDGDCEVTRSSTMNAPLFFKLIPAHEFGFQKVSASSIVFELPLNDVKQSAQEASASQLTLS